LLIQVSISAVTREQPREATPAIVNPVLRSNLSQTISLDGRWDFATDPEKKGEEKQWYRPDVKLPNKRDMQVPGCWEAQGVGEPDFSHGKRMVFEAINRRIRAAYIGSAWYKKTMNIPASWAGKRIWIKFGGVNSAGWIWVNGKFVAKQYEYTGAYKYDITDIVTAGQSATVAVLVCNDIPSLQGESQCVRTYGGLYRSVELEATGDVFVDYAYVQGDLDTKSAAVHATIRSAASERRKMKVEIKLSTLKERKAGKASKSVTVEPGKTVPSFIVRRLARIRR
jgi:beta-galactosidase